jgi:hypothetical protein
MAAVAHGGVRGTRRNCGGGERGAAAGAGVEARRRWGWQRELQATAGAAVSAYAGEEEGGGE